jgi:hypothetical protein
VKYDEAYEVVDERRGVQKLSPCGAVRPIPGGLFVTGLDGRGVEVLLPDDEEGFSEDPERGTITMMTPTGRITLVELRDANFYDNVAPFIEDTLPEFASAAARARYLHGLIQES